MYSDTPPEYARLLEEINKRGNKTKEEFYKIIQENTEEQNLIGYG